MLPVLALVGRPNVGKSTLFNQLTRSRDALVANLSGLTRDRQYGQGTIEDRPFIVIDTGGISGEEYGIDAAMAEQAALLASNPAGGERPRQGRQAPQRGWPRARSRRRSSPAAP